MKTSKMLELIESLKVGEKVVIEKFKDHLFVEKEDAEVKSNENVNAHGVDLSILNEEDWFYVEVDIMSRWMFKGDMFKGDMFQAKSSNMSYNIESERMIYGNPLCSKNEITKLRVATDEDRKAFSIKYPQYAPVKVGDIGLYYDYLNIEQEAVQNGTIIVRTLTEIRSDEYSYQVRNMGWKHFFKVSENETIAEIKERFLREVGRKC